MLAISVYLDTNLVAAVLIPEPLSDRAERFLASCEDLVVVSDLVAVEFSSLLARRIRTREFTVDQARTALANFDAWTDRLAERADIHASDLSVATSFLRRLDLPLRSLDAIHIAAARRIGATLVTFDRQMEASARALGMAVATP
ncbi:MAG TPA: type II toxin-antitoxin system VapC family toxin [Stellaceae bacterium]|nr:type II toxin-antitoxin system VapC family toxin [Stellaceae bacterium]